MALVVESGAGLSTAESYISEADADTYFTAHGSPSAWTGLTSAQKESALRYATQWLDGAYEWDGSVVSATQALGWPRSSAYDEEGRSQSSSAVPTRVEQATCEVALSHVANPVNATQARGGMVTRQKAGSVEVEYAAGAPAEVQLPHVTRILGGLGVRKGATVRLERA